MKTNRFEQEVIPCTMCGDDTPMLGTKLCDPCWQLDSSFRDLVRRHRDKAKIWLRAQVAEFGR